MKNTLNYSYFDLDIISKFESFEEFPNTKPVILSDSYGLILFANNSARIKHKFKEGRNLFDFKSEPDLESLFTNLTKNRITSFSTDFVIKDENNFYSGYLLNIEKVIIKNEDVFIIYIESQDNRTRITKKINSYNQALESVNVGVLLADKNANINYLSTSFEEFLHKNIEDVYNKNLIEVFKKHLSAQEIIELQYSVDHYKNWVKVISDFSNDSEVLYKEIRLNTVQDNIDKSISFIVTANDITEHIKQARLLKISEQKQKSIINNISDPILILRKEKNILIFENANNSFYENILSTKNEIKPESKVQGVLSGDLFNSINISLTNLNNSNRIHSQFHFTSENNKRYLGKITFTDANSDHIKLFIISMTDITEQLEIERKLREAYKKEISLNKLKSTFLAKMSHEIRTPLNAIVGYSDLLEDDVKAKNFESSAQMTTYLKEGVNRLLKLVDNIVEVSLLESGNEEIELAEIDLNSLINSNKDYWYEEAKVKSIQFSFDLSQNEITIFANEEKLNKAINEIVDNAIKYSNENGKIIISTFDKPICGTLCITDFGVGIDKNNLQKILQIFEQGEDVGYTRKYEGAGLGLSLANKLISYMKGELIITSELTKGTSVKIVLPKE
ncbi:MAG: ATP-binding protein [Melioribacteraceae bacterium]